jgi:hypothetical protein
MRVPLPFRAVESWGRQLTAEVVGLPKTMSELREGAENFRRVTQRMLDATAGLEQFNDVQASAGDLRQRVDKAARAVREQMGSVPGGERVGGPLEDLNSTLAAMARLSSLWPPGPRRPQRDPE